MHACMLRKLCGFLDARNSIEQTVILIIEYRKSLDAIKKTHVLLMDEVSIVSCSVLEKAERVFREVRKEQAAFSNVQVILWGDLFQFPSVPNRLLGRGWVGVAYVFQNNVFETQR